MIRQPIAPRATRDAVDRRLRRAYGFEEVALVPGEVTVDPAEVDLAVEIGGRRLEIPFMAAAMDAVSDPEFAVRMTQAGGLAFVNLEGLYARFDDPSPIIERVASASSGEEAAKVLAELEKVAALRDTRFEGPVTREGRQGGSGEWDRFAIVARLERVP